MTISSPTLESPPEPTLAATCEPAIPAPVSGWRRLLGDWAVVGSAEMICQALGSATSLLLRMLLSPAQMGIWQAVKLFLSYANYANLGISKGAARELTIAMGRGDLAQVQKSLNLAFTVNTLTSLVYAAVLVGAGLWVGLTGHGAWAAAWAAGLAVGGVLAVLGRYVTFQITVLRAKQAFRLTSQVSVLEGLLTLGVACLATWLWGLAGLYLGTLTVMLCSLGYLTWRGDIRLRWAWDRQEIRRLIAIGSPILLSSVVASVFASLDRLMILAYLSDREFQLGCYSLTLMVATQLYGIGNMLSIVMGPRYGEKFGQSGDRRQVALLAARATELQAAVMALPAALALVLAAPVLGRLLPDYRTGLAPLVWALPGVILQSLALPPSQFLVAVDRQTRALFVILAATGLAAAGNHVALTGGYGLTGVAAATAIAYGAYFVLSVAVSIWPDLPAAERFRYVTMLMLVLCPTMGLAILLNHPILGLASDWPTTVAKAIAVLSAWGATIRIAWHQGRWREALGRRSAPVDRAKTIQDNLMSTSRS